MGKGEKEREKTHEINVGEHNDPKKIVAVFFHRAKLFGVLLREFPS